jgi:hypothetical protein
MRRPTKICLVIIQLFFVQRFSAFSQAGWIPSGTDTACVGGLSFFQKLYGGNKDEIAFDIIATSDSGYIVVGQTSGNSSGGYDGLVLKINKRGQIVWSRSVGGSGNDVFYSMRKTADNGFIACGQTKSFGNPSGDAWLVKFDANGIVQWSKRFGDGNPNGDIAWDVSQLSDGGFAICGAHQFAGGVSSGFIVRTDNQGSIIWNKQYGTSGSDELWGLIEDGSSIVAVGFFSGASYYDGYMIKLDKIDGSILLNKRFKAEARSTLMAKIHKTTSGYQIYSLVCDDFIGSNQNAEIWNVAPDGTVQNIRKLIIQGEITSSYGWLTTSDGGFIVATGQSGTSADIYFTQVNSTGGINWSKKFLRSGQQILRNIALSPEGGFAGAGLTTTQPTIPDSNNVFIIRIDSSGFGGNCSGNNTNEILVVNASYANGQGVVSDLGPITFGNTTANAVTNSFSISSKLLCYDCRSITPPPAPDTSCTNGISFFQKWYGSNKEDIAFDIVSTNDTGYVIAGQTSGYGSGMYDGLIIKFNRKGSILWSKAIGGAGNDVFYGLRKTTDNGFIACGQTKSFGNSSGDAWLVKLDLSGSVQWSKKFGDGNPYGDIAWDVTQLSDGGFAICGAHQFAGGVSSGFVVRTDNLGNVLWNKSFGASGSDELWGLTEDGANLIVTGFYSGSSFYDGYLMKIDKTNGAILLKKSYKAENRSTLFAKIRSTASGYQIYSLVCDDFNGTNQNAVIWNIANDGTVVNIRKITISGSITNSYGWIPYPDGGFVAALGQSALNSDVYLTKVNAAGNLVWSKMYGMSGQQVIRNIVNTVEGIVATGITSNFPANIDSNNVLVFKVDSTGNGGACGGFITNDISVNGSTFTSGIPPISDLGSVSLGVPSVTAGVIGITPSQQTLCIFCRPKATRTLLPVIVNNDSHSVRVYPNPIFGGQFICEISSLFTDIAKITLVDIYGNIILEIPSTQISKGVNRIDIYLPRTIKPYSNYFMKVQFKTSAISANIFLFR